MHTPLTRRAIALSALAALALPLPSFAATTPTRAQEQQMLNQAVERIASQAPLKVDALIKATLKERALRAPLKNTVQTGSMQFHVTDRLLAKSGTTQDSEGSFVVDALDLKTESMPLKLDGPASIEWKTVGSSAYFRVATLPQSLIDMMKLQGVDLSQVVGNWVSADTTNPEENIPSSLLSNLPESGALNLPEQTLSNLKSKQHLVITRVEKRETVNGHVIARLRVAPNSSEINRAWNAEIREIYKTKKGLERKNAIKDVNTRYGELRKTLAKAHFVVVLDETAGTLQRLEIGGADTKPKQDCTFNAKTWKDVCKTTGTQYMNLEAGINFSTDNSAPVIAPSNAQPLKTVLENWFKSLETPTDTSTTTM